MCTHKKVNTGETKLSFEAIALAGLISYIEEIRETEEIINKLSSLVHLYKSRLEQLGEDTSQRINAIRLKEKFLAQIPGPEAHKGIHDHSRRILETPYWRQQTKIKMMVQLFSCELLK